MRSISRRAGWSTVAKKSGSLTATRSTGICSRANQTRTVAGMRSSVRMLWNSSATISIVARSTGVVAACFSACLRWCNSSSIAGVLTAPPRRARTRRRPAPRRRRTMPCCASAIAARSAGDAGAAACCGRPRTPATGGRSAGSAARAPPRRGPCRAPAGSPGSSCASLRRRPPRPWPDGVASTRPRSPTPPRLPLEPTQARVRACRRMKGRRSTSGSTLRCTSQRLISW